MDFEKKLSEVADSTFRHEFKIKNFTDPPIHGSETVAVDLPIHMSVRGIGERPENKNFVVVRIQEDLAAVVMRSSKYYITPVLDCSCIFNILDVKGRKKFSRTFTFESDSKPSDVYEERYIERSTILNNASEYLEEDTLTVIVEGTIALRNFRNPLLPADSFPSHFAHSSFHVEQLEHGIKVYLPRYSRVACSLVEHSEVFRSMWSFPVRETVENRIPLIIEELPAFLSMLLFLETQKLVLHEVTIFDLYKIADKYDIPLLLERCRKYMEQRIPRNVSSALEFATYYGDDELKRIVESCVETRERNDNFQVGNNQKSFDFYCHTRPVCNNVIVTVEDFKRHFTRLYQEYVTQGILDTMVYTTQLRKREKQKAFNFYQ